MIRRMLMVLLVLGLALPALAAPLDHSSRTSPPLAIAEQHHDHGHNPQQPVPAASAHAGKHECIGCIVALEMPAISALSLMPFFARSQQLATLHASLHGKPDVPPPKA